MASSSSSLVSYQKGAWPQTIICRKKEKKERDNNHPYKVVEITPPPKYLGVRCFSPNLQCGESVTIEGQTYTISAVTHRYQLRKGKYEPSEKRLDVLPTGRALYVDRKDKVWMPLQYVRRPSLDSVTVFDSDTFGGL